eukprot:9177065-Pyramimonas_sp.AAC.1
MPNRIAPADRRRSRPAPTTMCVSNSIRLSNMLRCLTKPLWAPMAASTQTSFRRQLIATATIWLIGLEREIGRVISGALQSSNPSRPREPLGRKTEFLRSKSSEARPKSMICWYMARAAHLTNKFPLGQAEQHSPSGPGAESRSRSKTP